jgi:hypothetical protein
VQFFCFALLWLTCSVGEGDVKKCY